MELHAPSHWRCVDFISDLHLQASEHATFETWAAYMRSTQADAVFILGDLFEVWIGDDAVAESSFEAACIATLRSASERLGLYVMQGNRDFLMGEALMRACGASALPDPSVLVFGSQRWLLSHGDALCSEDHEYQAFRQQVRHSDWQRAFLQKPVAERQAIARGIREASESRKQHHTVYADLDTVQTLQWLAKANSPHLIHGHTHRPGDVRLDNTHQRSVLSDWDAGAQPVRAEVLRLTRDGTAPALIQRIAATAISSSRD